MKRISALLILSIAGCVFFSCNGSGADPEPEEPEYVEQACVMAESIELVHILGCQAYYIPGVEQNEFQRLVLEDHPLYDTIYTRLLTDHQVSGLSRFPIRIDSAADLFLLCNTFGSIDYPQLWVTELEGDDCE